MVTRLTVPDLPDFDDFCREAKDIWDNRWLTNAGPFHERLEGELRLYLKVPEVTLFCNATTALIVALRALDLQGEVITTPFSFVATSNSIIWNNLTPVFVDIQRDNFNIDPDEIERAISEKTVAILAVHVFGKPCDVNRIEQIAQRHSLKVIYDAAHAFGVECHCGSVLNHGDMSVLSFHATKVLNTFEGGAVVCRDKALTTKLKRMRNFGFVTEEEVEEFGLNGKMSELHALTGLLQLKHIDELILKREIIRNVYVSHLKGIRGIRFRDKESAIKANFSYFPILVLDGARVTRDQLYVILRSKGFMVRKYFYPLIPEFSIYRQRLRGNFRMLKNALKVSRQILCLPIYPELSVEIVKEIAREIRGIL